MARTVKRFKIWSKIVDSCPDCPSSTWWVSSQAGDLDRDEDLRCLKMEKDTTVQIPSWCPLLDLPRCPTQKLL